jgi:hypothetical protein
MGFLVSERREEQKDETNSRRRRRKSFFHSQKGSETERPAKEPIFQTQVQQQYSYQLT